MAKNAHNKKSKKKEQGGTGNKKYHLSWLKVLTSQGNTSLPQIRVFHLFQGLISEIHSP